MDVVVAHIHAPKCEDESNEVFEKHHNAACRLDQRYNYKYKAKVEQHMNDLDSFTTRNKGVEEPQVNIEWAIAHVPMAEKFAD